MTQSERNARTAPRQRIDSAAHLAVALALSQRRDTAVLSYVPWQTLPCSDVLATA